MSTGRVRHHPAANESKLVLASPLHFFSLGVIDLHPVTLHHPPCALTVLVFPKEGYLEEPPSPPNLSSGGGHLERLPKYSHVVGLILKC